MDYYTIPLSVYLQLTNKENISPNDFKCGHANDGGVKKFLISNALQFEKRDIARTFLIVEKNSTRLLGYFTTTFKIIQTEQFDIDQDISNELMKSWNVKKRDKTIHGFLIAQLGKNEIENNDIHLVNILLEAYRVIKRGSSSIGGRLILLECDVTKEHLINYYKKHGFKTFGVQKIDERDIHLTTLYIDMKRNRI